MEPLTKNDIQSAERIALPKGEKCDAYRQEFQRFGDIDVPLPNGRASWIEAGGREFVFLRNLDIPSLVGRGLIDVAATSTDALFESERYDTLDSISIGGTVCRFSVLTVPERAQDLQQRMAVERRFLAPMASFPTALPRALERVSEWRDYPFRAWPIEASGSIEAYTRLLGIPGVADIVDTGITAQANGLVEAFKIFDVSAVAIKRKQQTRETESDRVN